MSSFFPSTPNSSPGILLIDDDQALQQSIREFLESYGYFVFQLFDGRNVTSFLESNNPQLILLDVMMPGEDGFSVLQKLRSFSKIPVIMLTARGDDTDRIVGLEMGADDYLAKPFNPRELLARIKAVLRRSESSSQSKESGEEPSSKPHLNCIQVGDIVLDVLRQSLHHKEKSLELSTTEFQIIQAFMMNPGLVLSRDQILSLAFGQNHYVGDRNIDVYISRIRGILRQLDYDSSVIKTVWGSGYSWRDTRVHQK